MPPLIRFVPLIFIMAATSLLAQTTDDSYAQIPILGESGEKKLQGGDVKGAVEDLKKAFEASRELARQYPQEIAYSENAYFYLGRLAYAFGTVNDFSNALQMAEPGARGYAQMAAADPSAENKGKASDALGALAWYQMLTKDGPGAEASARQSLELDPGNNMVKVNLAHALLVSGKLAEAKAIYEAERNATTSDGRSVRDVILKDFDTMEAAGVRNESIGALRKELGGKAAAPRRKKSTGAV